MPCFGSHFENGRHLENFEIFQCQESIRDINDVLNWFLTLNNFYWSPFSKWPPIHRTNSTLSDFNDISTHIWNVVEIGQCWICAVLWWPFWKWRPTEIFRSQESIWPISTTFHMWVDYDVLNWFPTSKNFYRSPFSKWPPQYRKNSTLFDFKGNFWFIF
jgi:hypothetical protein